MTLAANDSSFWAATKTQARVIVAMTLRDLLDQAGGSVSGMIMLFGRPAIIVVAMMLAFGGHTPQGMSPLAFIITGWISYFAFIRTFKSFGDRGSIVLYFPQVTPLDIMLTNLVVEWFVYTLVFIMFCVAALLLERSPPPANPLQVLMGFWAIEMFGCLLGLIMTSLARLIPVLDNLTIVYRRAAVVVSGIAISAADTPPQILSWMSWSPLFQCIELMREAWWPAYVSPIGDAGYVAKCLFFMAAFGLAAERFTRRYMK